MQYDTFLELHELFPAGRYELNSLQLADLLHHRGCNGIAVRVLNLGVIALDRDELVARLQSHPRLDGIRITCLDGTVIVDEPSHGH